MSSLIESLYLMMTLNPDMRILDLHNSIDREVLRLVSRFTFSAFLYLFFGAIFMSSMIPLVLFTQHDSCYSRNFLELPNYK